MTNTNAGPHVDISLVLARVCATNWRAAVPIDPAFKLSMTTPMAKDTRSVMYTGLVWMRESVLSVLLCKKLFMGGAPWKSKQ